MTTLRTSNWVDGCKQLYGNLTDGLVDQFGNLMDQFSSRTWGINVEACFRYCGTSELTQVTNIYLFREIR